MIFCCEDCGVTLDSRNTKGSWRERKPKTLRCGGCYLKWKKEVRRLKGET